VAGAALSIGIRLAGFLDDDGGHDGELLLGLPVVSWARFTSVPTGNAPSIALGIGDNNLRRQIFERLAASGLEILTVVHRSAVVERGVTLGAGTVVMAGAVVNPDARVGVGAILNTGCVVEHDCALGEFVHISPNAALAGGVRIGAFTHVGLGAAILPRVSVGSNVRVGAGAVVVRDVEDGATVVGVPARAIERRV
jgi:sugar O-acyltransferase (sialic acid O-acetyltransferase NeuD family)